MHMYAQFFEHQNYIGVAGSYPCPRGEPACAPGVHRPPRALWMYDMIVDTRPGRNDYANPLCYIPSRNMPEQGNPIDPGSECFSLPP